MIFSSSYYPEHPHITKETIKEDGAYLHTHKNFPAGCVYDIISCNTAKALYYLENTLVGKNAPAITINEFKKGRTYYVASQFDYAYEKKMI